MITSTDISAIERRRRGLRRERRFGPRRQCARRHRRRDQDRADHALQRPRLRLWRDRPHRDRLFQDDQRAGRRERPQDQSHQPRRRLQSAEDGRAGAPPGRAREGRVPVPDARHRVATWRSGSISTTTRCRSCSSSTGAAIFSDPEHFPWTIGLQSQLPDRSAHLRQAHSGRPSPTARSRVLYQNDGFGKDYLIGLQGRARRGSRRHDRQGGVLRDFGADGRFADRDACRAPARTSSSSAQRRNSPRRRSANPSISAGTRPAISATSRPRSRRS